ncbi:DUF4815 domain-containing protein [Devosia sp.]|uniref:DUF4815 domain-containing protein n=1 Tax=Devosia sp. TaxID=1871048 RepID=UPI0032637CE0
MAFEVPGVPAAYDRGPSRPGTSAVVFREGAEFYAQAADLNEAHTIARLRGQRISDRVMKDGDRADGAEANVDTEAGTVHCFAGRIYIGGDIYPIEEAVLADVPMDGEVSIGVRVIRTIVTEIEDPTLYGLHPGTAGEGEPGAARQEIALAWGFTGDGQEGELHSVYRLLGGTIITQLPPPSLSGVLEQISIYDDDLNGNYIVDGCEVTALGLTGENQRFSIGAGTANIKGYKRIREAAFTLLAEEDPALELVSGETHTFTGSTGGSTTIPVSRAPIDSLTIAIVVKRAVESVVRGGVPGGTDALTFAGAFEIESIVQGATTFDPATYAMAGNAVNWGPVGAEPVAASTYDVTYLYNVSVLDTATHTETTVTVHGGVNSKPVILGYTSKVPRIDLVCLDITGRPVYVKGLSARRGALPPIAPDNLLKLAEVRNDWLNVPVVTNNGTRNYTQDSLRRLFNRLITMLDQFDRTRLESDVRVPGTPVSKRGIFTDTFVDDFYRDPGEAQTAAVNRGVLQLAIDNVLMQVVLGEVLTLPFTEEVVVSQPQRTSFSVINPFDNFTPFPAGMRLEPAADFWTEQQVTWTSPVTQEFTAAPNVPPGQTSFDEVAANQQTAALTLRQIPIDVTLSGFGVGETLAVLTFDGIDVKPAGTQTADADGEIALTFDIPAGVPVGRRLVYAEGAADSFAEAIFVGAGQIDVATMRRVTLVTRAAPPPVVIVNNTIVQQTFVTLNQLANPIAPRFADPSLPDWAQKSTDPLAQSFRVPAPRFVTGVNFWMEAVGDPQNGIRIQLAAMENGFPTTNVLAEAFVSMATVDAGDKILARFDAPVFLDPTRLYCFVILTADGEHAVSTSRLGDVLGTGLMQERVSAQPYTIGDMFSSSNRVSWQVHPDEDISFEIVGAVFTSNTRTQNLWTGALSSVSDLLVRGAIEIPTQDAGFRFEIVRADASVIKLTSGQTHEFSEFVSETVTLRAVLTGTESISPVLYPGTLLAGGRIRTTGTYVSRVFEIGTTKEIDALFAAYLPSGSSVTADVDDTTDAWQALTLDSTYTLGDGWVEPKYKKASYTASEGRLRITLNGGPDKRLSIAALRGYSI